MACITFVTLGATKAEKLSALQLDQEGLSVFFKKAKMIKSCWIMLALQTISRLGWLHIWKESWHELFWSSGSSMDELDLCCPREIWLIGTPERHSCVIRGNNHKMTWRKWSRSCWCEVHAARPRLAGRWSQWRSSSVRLPMCSNQAQTRCFLMMRSFSCSSAQLLYWLLNS